MTELEILEYINTPRLLAKADMNKLNELINQNPFFQTAHILFLKALKIQNDADFENQLKKSSPFISDRDLLFKYLNQKVDTEIVHKKIVEVKSEPEKTIKNEILLKNKNVKRKINESFEGMGENISETISSQLEFSVVKDKDKLEYPSEIYFIEEERNGKNNIITIDADPEDIKKLRKKKDILDIEEVISKKQVDNLNQNQKYDEPFELIASEKIQNEAQEENQSVHFDITKYADQDSEPHKDDLISKFIMENPRIKPVETEKENHDLSVHSAKEDSSLLSETLINVYIKQGLFEKAIHSYQKLSLKYPEKSAYFASQIKILEQKINKQ
ncbi:hypothetical protein ACFLS4_02625 [Bacteroidota bacterium]